MARFNRKRARIDDDAQWEGYKQREMNWIDHGDWWEVTTSSGVHCEINKQPGSGFSAHYYRPGNDSTMSDMDSYNISTLEEAKEWCDHQVRYSMYTTAKVADYANPTPMAEKLMGLCGDIWERNGWWHGGMVDWNTFLDEVAAGIRDYGITPSSITLADLDDLTDSNFHSMRKAIEELSGVHFSKRSAKATRRKVAEEKVRRVQDQLNGSWKDLYIYERGGLYGWTLKDYDTAIIGTDAIFSSKEEAIADFEETQPTYKLSRRARRNKRASGDWTYIGKPDQYDAWQLGDDRVLAEIGKDGDGYYVEVLDVSSGISKTLDERYGIPTLDAAKAIGEDILGTYGVHVSRIEAKVKKADAAIQERLTELLGEYMLELSSYEIDQYGWILQDFVDWLGDKNATDIMYRSSKMARRVKKAGYEWLYNAVYDMYSKFFYSAKYGWVSAELALRTNQADSSLDIVCDDRELLSVNCGSFEEADAIIEEWLNGGILARKAKRVKKADGNWRGNPDIQMKYNGDWADPDLIYKDYVFNYWDIEDALWEMFIEDGGSESDESGFDRYVQENAVGYLEDVIAGGYFSNGSKSWHNARRTHKARRVKKADIWEDNGEYLRGFDMMGHEFTAHKPLGLESPLYEDMWVLTVEWGNEDLSDWGDGGHPHIIGEFDSFDELDDFVSREWYNVDRWDGDMGYFGRKAKKARHTRKANWQLWEIFNGEESLIGDYDNESDAYADKEWYEKNSDERAVYEVRTARMAFKTAYRNLKRAYNGAELSQDLEDDLDYEAPFADEDAVYDFVWSWLDDKLMYYDDQWDTIREYADPKDIFAQNPDILDEFYSDAIGGMSYDLDHWTEENFEKEASKKISKTALRQKLALYADEVAYDIEGFLKADGPFADEDEVREYIDSCIDNALIYYDEMWKVIEDYGDPQEIWESNPYILENFFDDVYSQIGDYQQYIKEEGEE